MVHSPLIRPYFLGGVGIGEGFPLTFSMTPGHVALLTCFLRELGRSKPKMKRSNLAAKIPGARETNSRFCTPEKRPKGRKRRNVHLLSIQFFRDKLAVSFRQCR